MRNVVGEDTSIRSGFLLFETELVVNVLAADSVRTKHGLIELLALTSFERRKQIRPLSKLILSMSKTAFVLKATFSVHLPIFA